VSYASRSCGPARFAALLEWRRRVDQCLLAVVMEADLQNMPTRKVDALVKALGRHRDLQKASASD